MNKNFITRTRVRNKFPIILFFIFYHRVFTAVRETMERLINDSLLKSQSVHKSIKAFQDEIKLPCSSAIVFRVKSWQLALIKNEYLDIYREHAIFVEKYEEKLKKILKREAQISKNK
jgi:hypothetical protein